jgi:hypothetical protein
MDRWPCRTAGSPTQARLGQIRAFREDDFFPALQSQWAKPKCDWVGGGSASHSHSVPRPDFRWGCPGKIARDRPSPRKTPDALCLACRAVTPERTDPYGLPSKHRHKSPSYSGWRPHPVGPHGLKGQFQACACIGAQRNAIDFPCLRLGLRQVRFRVVCVSPPSHHGLDKTFALHLCV